MTEEAFKKAKELIASRENFERLLNAVLDAKKYYGTKIIVQYSQYETTEILAFPKDMRDLVLAMAKDYYLAQIEKLNAELEAL